MVEERDRLLLIQRLERHAVGDHQARSLDARNHLRTAAKHYGETRPKALAQYAQGGYRLLAQLLAVIDNQH